jgi:hypothetical protein
VGFEPTHISVVEIQAGLKSTALDHSAIVSRMEKLDKFRVFNVYNASKTTYDGCSGGEQKGVVLFGDFVVMRGSGGVMSALVEHVLRGVEPIFAATHGMKQEDTDRITIWTLFDVRVTCQEQRIRDIRPKECISEQPCLSSILYHLQIHKQY